MKIASCRSCSAPIIWTCTKQGNRMPVDAVPLADDGASGFILFDGGQGGELLALYKGPSSARGEPLYASHFATCPQAAQHRRTR